MATDRYIYDILLGTIEVQDPSITEKAGSPPSSTIESAEKPHLNSAPISGSKSSVVFNCGTNRWMPAETEAEVPTAKP